MGMTAQFLWKRQGCCGHKHCLRLGLHWDALDAHTWLWDTETLGIKELGLPKNNEFPTD